MNFGAQHWISLSAVIALAVALPWAGRRRLQPVQQLWVARVLAVLTSIGIGSWVIIRMVTGQFDWREDIPLHLCNVIALLLPLLLWTPTRRIHEVLYFMVLSGTLQAVLTPDLVEGFPHYSFLKYWVVHGGLIVHLVYVCVVWRYYPTLAGILRTWVWMNAYFVCMLAFNLVANTNYFYVMQKPPTATLLDYLGPWPWYLLTGQLVALALFALAWLPFVRLNRAPSIA